MDVGLPVGDDEELIILQFFFYDSLEMPLPHSISPHGHYFRSSCFRQISGLQRKGLRGESKEALIREEVDFPRGEFPILIMGGDKNLTKPPSDS
jgi:hypothetical protein